MASIRPQVSAKGIEDPVGGVLPPRSPQGDDYPTSDGRPMGETDLHRDEMFDEIETLKLFFEGQKVYVTGNILVFYEPGNRRKHVSPDVMVVKGLEHRQRENVLLWNEGKTPSVVIEVTSKSTSDEDREEKYKIYRDQIKVAEYFLFDPRSEYLNPSLQGYRWVGGQYVDIHPVAGRFSSKELGLHLERKGTRLRFYDPKSKTWLLTPRESWERAEAGRRSAEAEVERLRRELEAPRKKGPRSK